jgi:uncharacterized protein (TIGR02996 family)
MTRTEEALMAAVIADPEDDLPRLAYADFCGEHGDDARAELIRVQLEMEPVRSLCNCCSCVKRRGGGQHHNGPCGLDCRDHRHLRRRERELLHDPVHWWAWLAGLYAITGRSAIDDLDHCSDVPDTFAVRFRRGFVADVALPTAAWVRHGPALVRAAPLERVTLFGKEPYCPAWESLPPGAHPCWWWVCASRHNANRPEALPRPLFRALARLRREERRTGTGLGFADRDAALAALSEAARRWARAAAVAAPPAAGV